MKRAKTEDFIELQWACQSAKDPDKPGLKARFVRHCNCDECRGLYSDVAAHAVKRFTGKGGQHVE